MMWRMLILTWVWLTAASACWADHPEPVSAQTLEFPKAENPSTSPLDGTTRFGGGDHRTFRFTPDGRFLIGMDPGAWRFDRWDVTTGTRLGAFGRVDDAYHMAISPDSRHLVNTGGRNGVVAVWNLEKTQFVHRLDEGVNFAAFGGAAFLDNRRCVLAGIEESSLVICIWDIETGDELERFALPSIGAVSAVAVSPGGATLGLVEGSRVVLRERYSGGQSRVLAHLPLVAYDRGGVAMASFSPDGKLFAVAHGESIRLYNILTGTELPPLFAHGERVRAFRFSSDGKLLHSLGDDRRLLTFAVASLVGPIADAEPPAADEIEPLIADALGEDAVKGYHAARRLAMASQETVTALRGKVKPATPLTAEELDRILTGLSSPDIAERKVAARAMDGRRDQVYAAIRDYDRGRGVAVPAAERAAQRERASRLRRFDMRDRLGSEADEQRRAQDRQFIGLLMRLGTPEAKAYLSEIAGGAPTAAVTIAAADALRSWPDDNPKPAEAIARDEVARRLSAAEPAPSFAAVVACAQDWPAHRDAVRTELLRLAALDSLGDDQQEAERLIALLDDEDFATREDAGKRLQTLGKGIAPLLRAKLAADPTPEAKLRLDAVLVALKPRQPSADERLAWRLVEVATLTEGTQSALLAEAAEKCQSEWLRERIAAVRGSEK